MDGLGRSPFSPEFRLCCRFLADSFFPSPFPPSPSERGHLTFLHFSRGRPFFLFPSSSGPSSPFFPPFLSPPPPPFGYIFGRYGEGSPPVPFILWNLRRGNSPLFLSSRAAGLETGTALLSFFSSFSDLLGDARFRLFLPFPLFLDGRGFALEGP